MPSTSYTVCCLHMYKHVLWLSTVIQEILKIPAKTTMMASSPSVSQSLAFSAFRLLKADETLAVLYLGQVIETFNEQK